MHAVFRAVCGLVLLAVAAGCAPAAPPPPAQAPTSAPAVAAPSAVAAAASPASSPATAPAASPSSSPAIAVPSAAVSPVASPSAVAAMRPDQVSPLAQRASLKLALASNNYVWLALMYALDRGYFDRAGLNIEVTPITGSSAAMLPVLARGDVDLSPTTPSPATFNQVTEGFDIQVVAGGPLEREGRMASVWLTVLKDRADDIKDLKDLKGHTLEAGAQGTPFDLAVLSAVKQAGLDPATDVTITYRVRANSDLLVLAQNKAADVIAMVEPLASQAEKQGLVVRWKPIAAVAPWYESAQLAASSKSLQTNAAAVQKFLEVYVLTAREINATNGVWTDSLMQTATRWSQLDPDTIRGVGAPPLYPANGMPSLDSLRQAQQFLVDQGGVKTPIDVQKLVDTALLDAALERIGRAQ